MRNAAAELGPSKFSWWPDWSGQAVIIVACGASASGVPLHAARGRAKFVGIKEAVVHFCPWADVAYGCDGPWWLHKNGLPEFKGLKFCYDAQVCAKFPDLKQVRIDNPAGDQMLFDEPLSLGAGGNSGFQTVNLVGQFGSKMIGLVGFDASDKAGRGPHWYGRSTWPGANNPDETNFRRWRDAFSLCSSELKYRGIDVVNLATDSEIKCFPKMNLAAMMERWGL